jgi:hypothetical protein
LQKDFRIVDEPPPAGKDFNNFLMSHLGIARQKPSRERGMPDDCRMIFFWLNSQTEKKNEQRKRGICH